MSTTKTILVQSPNMLNLEQCQKVLAAVLNKAGHPQCFSGFKLGFQNVVDPELHLGIDKNLGVTEIRGIGA